MGEYLPATIADTITISIDAARDARALPVHPETKKVLAYWDPRTLQSEYDEPTPVPIKWDYGYATVASNDLPLWDRLEGEPVSEYSLFQKYLAMPAPRSIITLAEQLDISPVTVGNAAALYIWHLRAYSYDLYLELLSEQKALEAVEEVESRHKTFAKKLLRKVEEALEAMEPEEIGPQQMKDLIAIATQLERISTKMPGNAPAPLPLTRKYEKEKIEHEADAKAKAKPDTKRETHKTEIHAETAQIQVNYTDDWRSS